MRLDLALVAAGLTDSRARAQELIAAGVVRVAGKPAKKPSQKVGDEALSLTQNPNPYVSRAALKLAHALQAFQLSPKGAVALDVGASTGGFTQVLLEAGATKVYALDVGHGQLHPKLLDDPRVVNLEGTNAKSIPEGAVPSVDFIVTDVSFISLTKALPMALGLAKSGAIFVGLIKPQFEVGRANIGKSGIVKDDAAKAQARNDVRTFLEGEGWAVTHEDESPILGQHGNQEFLIAAEKL
ncbi:MAG: TlyA family RNA methyltransferase [Rhodobacteraceae bacterium]|nr:TlyA family RNA methyltransferase [Paracoccaceae bacterium]